MTDNSIKFPSTSDEVAKMLGFFGRAQQRENQGNSASQESKSAQVSHSLSDLPVANLPIAGSAQESPQKNLKPIEEKIAHLRSESQDNLMLNETQTESKTSYRQRLFKKLLPYVAVFLVGVFIYYFFLSRNGFALPSFNFSEAFQSVPKAVTPKESALLALEKQPSSLMAYQQWVAQFYYDVSDPGFLDPDRDNSGNGLSNFQKFLLNLNPKSYDTLGLGMADSQAIAQGINPLTGGQLTDAQKQIIGKYFDMEVISNRLALENMKNSNNVAGAMVVNNGQWFRGGSQFTSDQQQTDPGLSPYNLEINTSVPGRLEVPSLNINVPVIWTKDPKDFENDLQSGVVHYPGTALPGEIGTTYISGHSSNYFWAKGSFNQIFAKLGSLAVDTSFKITVVQKSGKDAVLHYVVVSRQEYLPTDQRQFQNTGKSLAALSTCWPVNSTAKRLVVLGQLTQVEQ